MKRFAQIIVTALVGAINVLAVVVLLSMILAVYPVVMDVAFVASFCFMAGAMPLVALPALSRMWVSSGWRPDFSLLAVSVSLVCLWACFWLLGTEGLDTTPVIAAHPEVRRVASFMGTAVGIAAAAALWWADLRDRRQSQSMQLAGTPN